MTDTVNPKVAEKVIDLVRKLLAKANDPSVTEAEAASYAAKAAQMLAAHNLSIIDIGVDDGSEPMSDETWAARYADDGWRRSLANQATKLYMCYLVMTNVHDPLTGRDKTAYYISGRPSGIEVFKEMYTYLDATVVRLGHSYAKARGLVGKESQKVRHDFEKGCGYRLADRISMMVKAAEAPVPASSGNRLPALYASEAELAAARANAHFGKLRDGRARTVHINSHGMAGRSAANTISLNSQVGGGSKSSTHLIGKG